MRKEYHIDFYEMKHAEDYEAEFNDCFIPSPYCAIRVHIPEVEDQYDYEPWELIMYADLAGLGFKPGDVIWVEVDY